MKERINRALLWMRSQQKLPLVIALLCALLATILGGKALQDVRKLEQASPAHRFGTSWVDDVGGVTTLKDGVQIGARKKVNFTGAGVAVSDDATNGRVNVSISTTSAAAVADLAALRALPTSGGSSVVVDGQQRKVGSDPVPWQYDSSTGAGFADDGVTLVKPNDVSGGANGRWYKATSAPVLATVAALRLAVSGIHQSISVQAYATLGDGGGDTFDYDPSDTTTADDSCSTFVAGTRRYKRRASAEINVKKCGAKGNDSTDDTTAIQAALNTKRRVFIPSGTYRITATLNLTSTVDSRCHGIRGEDAELSVIKLVGSSSVDAISDVVNGSCNRPLFEDFTVTTTNSNAQALFHTRSSYYVHMSRVVLNANDLAKYALRLEGGIGGANIAAHSYTDCGFLHAKAVGGYNVSLEERAGSAGITFKDCEISNGDILFNAPIMPKVLAGVAITTGTPNVTYTVADDGSALTSGNAGNTVVIPGAGPAAGTLTTTILSVTDPTHFVLNTNASTTVSGGTASVGAFASQNQGIRFDNVLWQNWNVGATGGNAVNIDLGRGTTFDAGHFESTSNTPAVVLGSRSAYGVNGSVHATSFDGVYFNSKTAQYAISVLGVTGSFGLSAHSCYFGGDLAAGVSAIQTQLHSNWALASNHLLNGWAPVMLTGTPGSSVWVDELSTSNPNQARRHGYKGASTIGDYTTAPLEVLENPTAATVGVQQTSPAQLLVGHGWKTNATAASQEVASGWQLLPVQGTANPTAQAHQYFWINGGSGFDGGYINSAGLWVSTLGFAQGTNPAQSGSFRISNATGTVAARNAANSADVTLISLSGTDALDIGDGTNSTTRLWANGLTWVNTATPLIQESNKTTNAATGQLTTVAGQNETGTTSTGGGLELIAGTGTTKAGFSRLSLPAGGMCEAVEIAAGQNILSLVKKGALTTTQMPASTGDGVIYIANASTLPSANSVGGGILYVDAGALKYRGTSGTVTTVGVP